MTLKDRALFLERTHDYFLAHKGQARAAGVCLNYQLDDLRFLIERQLARPICPYCAGPFSAATFRLLHKVPLCRGGRFSFRNLEIGCADCALLKGPLDAQEYRELLGLARSWPKPVRRHFLRRLQAGSKDAAPNLPPVGSLEWFTGSAEPHAPFDISSRRYKSSLAADRAASFPNVEEKAHEVHHG